MSLVLNNISKKFDTASSDTLRDISLNIEDGEFLCVIGPSGCGKTTLLNIIAGLENPGSGTLMLDGSPIEGAGPDRCVMFQEAALFPWLSVIENITFGLRLAGKTRAEQVETALQWLRTVQLAHFRDYYPHQLSGGMKQRVALARALALDSKVLLMDEPLAALDKQTRNKLREEIQELWMQRRRTVFFITHSVEEAIFFADRIVMMSANPGKIEREFNIDFPRPRHIEAPDFIELRALLLAEIRTEVDKSVVQEYCND
jgi:NitT/TauT family transport system ATP-binding protein